MIDTISVGIDVSYRSNQVYIIEPNGKVHKNFSVKNNAVGANTIISTTIDCLNLLNLTNVQFAMESTSVYGDNLVMHLKSDLLIISFL
jgi:transposase